MIPYLITAVTIVSHWVISRNELAGWAMYLVIDPLWIAFWINAGHWEFLPMCAFFLVVHASNFQRARRKRRAGLAPVAA